ncbi:hypothetical protein M758_10G142600 [Ceratodon purpureus]|nr:hypothetical protein M758_10G142600 [Ceratodon purpureus]
MWIPQPEQTSVQAHWGELHRSQGLWFPVLLPFALFSSARPRSALLSCFLLSVQARSPHLPRTALCSRIPSAHLRCDLLGTRISIHLTIPGFCSASHISLLTIYFLCVMATPRAAILRALSLAFCFLEVTARKLVDVVSAPAAAPAPTAVADKSSWISVPVLQLVSSSVLGVLGLVSIWRIYFLDKRNKAKAALQPKEDIPDWNMRGGLERSIPGPDGRAMRPYARGWAARVPPAIEDNGLAEKTDETPDASGVQEMTADGHDGASASFSRGTIEVISEGARIR